MTDSTAEVIATMQEYIKASIEKPHPVFGGLPVCPFAQKARIQDKIIYQVFRFSIRDRLDSFSELMQVLINFSQNKRFEVLLVIHPDPEAMSLDEMENFINLLNQKISDIGLIAFGGHPNDLFNIRGAYTRQAPYIHFTVQTKELVKSTSDLLLKTRYYENWTPEQLKYIGFPRN